MEKDSITQKMKYRC